MTRRAMAGAALAFAGVTGCSDHVSGPEAYAVVTALEAPLDPGAEQLRASLFDRLGFRDVLERLSSASTIAVERDGRELAYHAIAFERLMVPTHGAAAGGDCVGPRWTLVAWRDGDDPGSFILTGGDFAQPIGARPGPCPGTDFGGPAPIVVLHPAPAAADQHSLVGVAGRGEVSPGTLHGTCGFLKPEDAQFLWAEHGIRCQVTRHRVSLSASVRRIDTPGAPISRITVRATDILGVRYTFHCDGTPRTERYCATPTAERR